MRYGLFCDVTAQLRRLRQFLLPGRYCLILDSRKSLLKYEALQYVPVRLSSTYHTTINRINHSVPELAPSRSLVPLRPNTLTP